MKTILDDPPLRDMQGDTIDVVSTSAKTADASPIVLQQSNQIRSRFIPKLVENENEPHKSLSGKLVYERKRQADTSFPSEAHETSETPITRRSIRSGDWMEINLDTSETYELFQGLIKLYKLYSDMEGIPFGGATFTRIDSRFNQFLDIIQNDPAAAKMIGNAENYELVKILLHLITLTDSRDSLKNGLNKLQETNLNHLTSSLNLEKLERIVALMDNNLENDNEEFWQNTAFGKNQWLLAQLFACPCTVLGGKAYVGGKNIGNQGSNLCDFLYKNSLTQNTALIEIKTPCTKIIGRQYRGTYSMSQELSGAVNQVLNYRDKLTKDFYSLIHNSQESFEVFSPRCIVLIGKISALSKDEIAAFETFRNNLNNVSIITYDELLQRVEDLISVLSVEDEVETQSDSSSDYDDDGELYF